MHQQPRRRQRPRHPLGQARTIRQQPQHRQPGMRHHALTIRGDYQPRDQPVTFTLEVLLDLNRCGSSTTPSNQVRSTFYLRRSYRLAHSRNRHTATPRRLNPTQETPCSNPSPPTSRPTTPPTYSNCSPSANSSCAPAGPTVHNELRDFLTAVPGSPTAGLPAFLDELSFTITRPTDHGGARYLRHPRSPVGLTQPPVVVGVGGGRQRRRGDHRPVRGRAPWAGCGCGTSGRVAGAGSTASV